MLVSICLSLMDRHVIDKSIAKRINRMKFEYLCERSTLTRKTVDLLPVLHQSVAFRTISTYIQLDM